MVVNDEVVMIYFKTLNWNLH